MENTVPRTLVKKVQHPPPFLPFKLWLQTLIIYRILKSKHHKKLGLVGKKKNQNIAVF